MNNRIIAMLLSIMILISLGCRKFVEVEAPNSQTVNATVFAGEATATSAIVGIYSEMMKSVGFANGASSSVTVRAGLSADELKSHSNSNNPFYLNLLTPTESGVSTLWSDLYRIVYQVNSALEGLQNSVSLTPSVKMNLEGEARFIRAFCYFYLVNLFGDVPLITGTDYKTNAIMFKTDKAVVYEQIIDDLKTATDILNDYFAGSERIRPNKMAAVALLARVYLYTNDFENAEIRASEVIADPRYDIILNLDNVFLKNSTETIWQLKPVVPNRNTHEGFTFILTSTPSNFSLSSEAINDFEPTDARLTKWTKKITVGSNTYDYAFKYKVRTGATITEYSTVLRLAEMFLIRAEARARRNNVTGSQNDINVIRNRAGLDNTTANNETSLLLAIEQERRVELFTEWGHRWLDLKRNNRANDILGPIKAPGWTATDALYPIPQTDINNNPNLTQNDGY